MFVYAYDYVTFCLTTCYSRLLFVIFPSKLNRLKQERMELGIEIKKFVDKHQVDPEYERLQSTENIDISKDDLSYLEGRYLIRRRSSRLEVFHEIDNIDALDTKSSFHK